MVRHNQCDKEDLPLYYYIPYVGLVDSIALQGYFLSLSLVTNKPCFSKHWSTGVL